ncbi:hypothetical protein GCM10010435_50390 [Winogradskya consettensis]|uniref:Beta-lactamase-related domain-containing protein n=1 Tax=Winogradskya consettensis TaxID=113560 RepID=A0A919SY36_9ACTN|nr:hypothetical protein Aco04nite_69290 [Actinoplanes consettensis]
MAEVRDHGATVRAAAGVARLDRPGRAPVDGRFRVGSVTKTFVATVVLQLAAEHRLRLDDPVARTLPGVVPNGEHITLRQLLNHTSGLFNVTEALDLSPSGWLPIRYHTWTAAQLVAVAPASPHCSRRAPTGPTRTPTTSSSAW